MRLHPPSLLWPGAVICWTRCVLECFDLSIPHSRSSQISVLICTKTRGQSHAAPTEHSMQGLYSCGNVSIITAVVGVGCIQLCQVFATMCDSHLPSMYVCVCVCVCVCVMSTLRKSYSIYLLFFCHVLPSFGCYMCTCMCATKSISCTCTLDATLPCFLLYMYMYMYVIPSTLNPDVQRYRTDSEGDRW